MTTINESLTAKGYTPAASVPQVFGRPRTIDGIVIHHWGSLGQTHDGVVDFFVNGPGQTSAHFVVSAGRIHCIVSPLDAAWHSGNAVGNATTIGIECRPEATDEDYATVAELVAFLRAEYGDLPLTPHRQWQATACPGVWDLARINQLAGATKVTTQSTTPKPPKEDTLSAAEVNQIIKAIEAEGKKTRDYAAALLINGYTIGGKAKPSLLDVMANTQGRVTGGNSLLAELVKNPDLTAEQIKDAVTKGMAEGIDLDATVTVKKAV